MTTKNHFGGRSLFSGSTAKKIYHTRTLTAHGLWNFEVVVCFIPIIVTEFHTESLSRANESGLYTLATLTE